MARLLIRIAIWVKAAEKVLRVLGVAFFVLALLTGVIWILGRNVESVAFVLGLISSAMFGAVELAKYFVPNRKAVRDMGIDELLSLVALSSVTDWKVIHTGLVSEAALKEDPRLRVTIRYDEHGTHQEDFREAWANKFPDAKARSYWVELTYDRALLDRNVLVSVDGGRALLPMPKSVASNAVSRLSYRFAELFDSESSPAFSSYFARAGLSVDT